VFELCLVGVMVIYELLGHVKPKSLTISRDAVTVAPKPDPARVQIEAKPTTLSPARKATSSSQKARLGSIKRFVLERLFPGEGERTDMKAMMQDYRAWCSQHGLSPLALREFLDEIEKICRQTGAGIEVGDDQRVYCLNVKLGTATEEQRPIAVH
jgi:hypothetical protein